jgi:large subunit ribosomal protein L23
MDTFSIIKSFGLTEKGVELSESAGKYFFVVHPEANKFEIKDAVEERFGVKVSSVNTQNYAGKRKRLRMQRYGKRSDWKRAIVTLEDGHKIDLT